MYPQHVCPPPAQAQQAEQARHQVQAPAQIQTQAVQCGSARQPRRPSPSRQATRLATLGLVAALASLLYDGRNVTWIGVFYGWPALAIAGGVAGSAAVLTLAARVWNVVRSGSWTRSPANPAASSAGTERADVSVS